MSMLRAAAGGHVDLRVPCFHCRLRRCLWSSLPLEVVLMFRICASAGCDGRGSFPAGVSTTADSAPNDKQVWAGTLRTLCLLSTRWARGSRNKAQTGAVWIFSGTCVKGFNEATSVRIPESSSSPPERRHPHRFISQKLSSMQCTQLGNSSKQGYLVFKL